MSKVFNITNTRISYNSFDDRDVFYFIKAVRQGISFTNFYQFSKKAPFSLGDWSRFLHMSERTMQRQMREKKTFDPRYSERILQIKLLYNLGVDVFGDNTKFDIWLDAKNLALGGHKPKELLDTSFGIGHVKDALNRIEHGALA